ncbi:sulfotransferase domain-containing protein, partial [Candidatus Pelagibacter ubique]|nr:sulfotransferase domain-containing protein [Candidatus Pelagibacter ubique]
MEKKKQNIIVSYPSSGWNYFNTIIKGYVKEEGISNDALIFAGINAKNIILNKRISNFHTHLCYFEIPFFGLGSIKKNKKIIISRNYITSIFSYYKKYKREISFDEFIFNGKSLKRLTDFYNSWSSNVDENENLYIVKYENLKNNPIKYFEEAIKFLNIDQNVDKQKLEKVLEEMSFEKIK